MFFANFIDMKNSQIIGMTENIHLKCEFELTEGEYASDSGQVALILSLPSLLSQVMIPCT
jgi:hypothetical protein